MLAIASVKQWMKGNADPVIGRLVLARESVDDYLDARDESPFDDDWTAAYESIEDYKTRLTEKEQDTLEKLSEYVRHLVYDSVVRRHHSADLAAYISDDFGLIADALAANIPSPWLNGLMQAYLNGLAPCGRIAAQADCPIVPA